MPNYLNSKQSNTLNTNPNSWAQILLGSHRIPTRAYQRMTPEEIAQDRKDRALMKMVDMTPEQKAAELKRLRAIYGG